MDFGLYGGQHLLGGTCVMFLDRSLDSITVSDIQALLDGEVPESRTIDYKRDLPGNTDSAKKEFLADISSFANSGGGILLFGLEESEGIPSRIVGLGSTDLDAAKLRLEQIAGAGLRPRVQGLEVAAVAVNDGDHCLIIRIPHSWNGPHMVSIGSSSRFFARHSTGKYQMDVDDIRQAFLRTSTYASQAKGFRTQRVDFVSANSFLRYPTTEPLLVLHFVPFSSINNTAQFSARALHDSASPAHHLYGPETDRRFNLDGVLAWAYLGTAARYGSHVQLFRSGALEAAGLADVVNPNDDLGLATLGLERRVIGACEQYSQQLKRLGAAPPFALFPSILNTGGVHVYPDRGRFEGLWAVNNHKKDPIVETDILLPEIVLESFDNNWPQVLRSSFDAIWNAGGWSHSLDYDEHGNWRG